MQWSLGGLGVGNQETIVWCWGLLSGLAHVCAWRLELGLGGRCLFPAPWTSSGLLERAPDMAAGFPRARGTGEQGERAVGLLGGVLSVRHCPFCPV